MAHVDPIDGLDIGLDFFPLPSAVDGWESIRYYLIYSASLAYVGRWGRYEILAAGKRSQHPDALTLRQLHFEEEDLEWDQSELEMWTGGNGSWALTRAEVRAIRDFIFSLADQAPPDESEGLGYFTPTSAAEYVACGLPQGLIERFSVFLKDADLFRYHPDPRIANGESYHFLSIGHWTTPHESSGTAFIELETYTPKRIAEIQSAWDRYVRNQAAQPLLDAAIMEPEHSAPFTAGALRAFAALLTERLDSSA
jgi:hypothetical protein